MPRCGRSWATKQIRDLAHRGRQRHAPRPAMIEIWRVSRRIGAKPVQISMGTRSRLGWHGCRGASGGGTGLGAADMEHPGPVGRAATGRSRCRLGSGLGPSPRPGWMRSRAGGRGRVCRSREPRGCRTGARGSSAHPSSRPTPAHGRAVGDNRFRRGSACVSRLPTLGISQRLRRRAGISARSRVLFGRGPRSQHRAPTSTTGRGRGRGYRAPRCRRRSRLGALRCRPGGRSRTRGPGLMRRRSAPGAGGGR